MTESRNAHPLTIFTLHGDETTMGRQHGQLTRELVLRGARFDLEVRDLFFGDVGDHVVATCFMSA